MVSPSWVKMDRGIPSSPGAEAWFSEASATDILPEVISEEDAAPPTGIADRASAKAPLIVRFAGESGLSR